MVLSVRIDSDCFGSKCYLEGSGVPREPRRTYRIELNILYVGARVCIPQSPAG